MRSVVALSTDKAAAPINLYGATKLCSDKLFVAANNFKGRRELSFSVVRYGNVMGSRGSVIPFFLRVRESGVLPITHPDMTRFNITLDEAVEWVLFALEHAWPGEIIVPKLPSYRLPELARAIAPECRHEIIGVRGGEKLHEEMITSADSFNAVERERHFAIVPSQPIWDIDTYLQETAATRCTPGFSYNSRDNDAWLDVDALRTLIREHLNASI